MATSRHPLLALALAVAVAVATACACAHPTPTPLGPHSRPRPAPAPPATFEALTSTCETRDASASDPSSDAAIADAAVDAPAADAASPLATLFDGDPSGGSVRLADVRCGPGCLQYPAGWLSADDGGFTYAWFFTGEGKFGTAEVMRCPLATLDDRALALRLKYAGGENVRWSPAVEGTVGKDHAHALVAEGIGTSRGRPAHFFYAYVDVAQRKDIVIAYVVDGASKERMEETIAVVKSVRVVDGPRTSRP